MTDPQANCSSVEHVFHVTGSSLESLMVQADERCTALFLPLAMDYSFSLDIHEPPKDSRYKYAAHVRAYWRRPYHED